MSLDAYREHLSIHAHQHSFTGLLMAAMKRASAADLATLKVTFPDEYAELWARENARGGILDEDGAQP